MGDVNNLVAEFGRAHILTRYRVDQVGNGRRRIREQRLQRRVIVAGGRSNQVMWGFGLLVSKERKARPQKS